MSTAVLVFRILLLLTVLAAFRWGGRTERRIALLYLLAAALTFVGRRVDGLSYQGFESFVALLDWSLLAVLMGAALRMKRWWLFATAALQLLTCLGHIGKLLDPALSPMGYFMMLVSSSYPSLILLGVGIWQHQKRQMRVL